MEQDRRTGAASAACSSASRLSSLQINQLAGRRQKVVVADELQRMRRGFDCCEAWAGDTTGADGASRESSSAATTRRDASIVGLLYGVAGARGVRV